MKKIIYTTAMALTLAILPANAETVMGEVISVTDDIVTVKTQDGQQMAFQTNDNTTYRKKALHKHHKKKRGMRGPADWTYEPIAEEDDWVEISYTPATNEMQSAEIQEVVVYDD